MQQRRWDAMEKKSFKPKSNAVWFAFLLRQGKRYWCALYLFVCYGSFEIGWRYSWNQNEHHLSRDRAACRFSILLTWLKYYCAERTSNGLAIVAGPEVILRDIWLRKMCGLGCGSFLPCLLTYWSSSSLLLLTGKECCCCFTNYFYNTFLLLHDKLSELIFQIYMWHTHTFFVTLLRT